MAENFDLIFGSSASQSYSWNDSDYQNGWQTVGDTPPTREQFDALQRRADLKAQELNNALTPLVNKSEADGRQASTAYTAGKFVTVDGLPNGWLLECVVGGTSGADAISIPATLVDGATIIDGDVTWKLRKIATEGGLGYRQPSTTYSAGQIAYHASLPTGYYLECTTGGTTGSGALTITSPSVGGTVSDGTVTWTVYKDNYLYKGITSNANLLIEHESTDVYFSNTTTDGLSSDRKWIINLDRGSGISYKAQIAIPSKINDVNSLFYRTWQNEDTGWSAWKQQEAIVAKSIGTNGYIKYASGLILQWVQVGGNVAANSDTRITFPISFSDINYDVSAIFMSDSIAHPGLMVNSAAGLLTNNYVTIRNSSAFVGTIKVFAIGY